MKRAILTCYGRGQDREKLEILAHAAGLTQSGWLIHQIREAFRSTFGANVSPDEVKRLFNMTQQPHRVTGSDGRRYKRQRETS